MMKYEFLNVEAIHSIEELKKAYFTLAKKLHSDITGGSDDKMKQLNAEYSELQKKLKDVHTSVKEGSDEPYYTAKSQSKETAGDSINIVSALLKLKLNVELCGRWLWITGSTKECKDTLKNIGCRWSPNKKAWSWHFPEDSAPNWHRKTSMSSIRNKYGSIRFDDTEQVLLG